MIKQLSGLFFIISKFAVLGQEGLSPRAYAETENGALLGNMSLSRDGRQYFQFLGIPYGMVPERFGSSRPPLPWKNSPRNALNYGPPCSQINEFTGEISGQEDCLYLNVYTPALPFRNNTPSLPVLFVIHMGGFSMGDAKNLGPSYMMDQNVIVITANYRLGPFGFLNTGTKDASGNQGLKDLVLALTWVNKEIKNFGGDPNRVVVEGSSSGSFAASYLTLSPLAKGLISGAISHSGSALCPWTNQFKSGMALSNAKKLGVAVDCPSRNPEYLVDCLKRLDPKVILQATFPADSVLFNVDYPQFGPSLETYKNPEDPESGADIFLGEDPYSLLKNGDFNRVPYILGLTANEGLLVNAAGVLSNDDLVNRLNTEWGRVAPNTFIYDEYSKDPCKVSAEISQFYFARKNISKEDPWTAAQLSAVYSDRWFHKCSRDFAILYAEFAPVYLYNFTRRGAHSLVDHFGWYTPEDQLKPPSHADEIQYLFHNPELFPEISSNPNETDPLDYNFSKNFIKTLTNFAATGVGKYFCTSHLCPRGDQEWARVKTAVTRSNSSLNGDKDGDIIRKSLQWLQLDENPKMEFEHADFLSRMEFWENLGLSDYVTIPSRLSPTTSTTISPLTTSTPIKGPSDFTTFSPPTTSAPTKCPSTSTTVSPPPTSSFTNFPPTSTTINPPTISKSTKDPSTFRTEDFDLPLEVGSTIPPLTTTEAATIFQNTTERYPTPSEQLISESQPVISSTATYSHLHTKPNLINLRFNASFLFSIMLPPFNTSNVQNQSGTGIRNVYSIPVSLNTSII